jgi:hypothetical protein
MTSRGAQTKCGLGTLDDFRFLRLWWEALLPGRWTPFAKGGAYSRWYSSVPLVLSWNSDGTELKTFVEAKVGSASRKVQAQEFYFRPGLTWPRRTQSGLGMRAMPADCIFADKGPAAFVEGDDSTELMSLLAITNSTAFCRLVELQMAFGSYEVGVIQRTPIPDFPPGDREDLARLSRNAWEVKCGVDQTTPTAHAFVAPALLTAPGSTLAERTAAWAARVRTSEETVAAIQAEIDDLAFRLYGLDAADRAALTSTLATEATSDAEAETGEDEEVEPAAADALALAADLLAYALGCALGRWDIRYTTGERPAPEPPDPFAPLPVCPPGMLQNTAGLPAAPGDVPASYPLRITWPGILVDDEEHPEDIERRMREVLAVLFPGHADAIADETCTLLGIKSLRDWFRKPAGFFADHLKRYSKSRRQAPIYWPLSTDSGSYTLWIYYHRLTDQTLFQCVNDFVKPKITEVDGDLSRLTAAGADKPGARAEIERLTILRTELVEFRDELLRVAQLPYKPNLNDGVLITASPLWKLFRLPKWQKDLKACWEALAGEKYEWAHLAYTIWPDRVKKVCKTDRSIAIAHGLEDLCEVKAPEKKVKRGKKRTDTELALEQD